MKASKRRARAKKQSLKKIEVAAVAAFSELEEAFFREGAALSVASSGSMEASTETFADLEDSRPRPSLWRRLFN